MLESPFGKEIKTKMCCKIETQHIIAREIAEKKSLRMVL